MEKFDDLFNSFFEKNNDDENNDFLNNEAKKIIEMIDNFKKINPTGEFIGDEIDKLDEELDSKLGEPDKIEYSVDGDLYIEKRIWFKEHGVIIKRLISDVPLEPLPELSLEEKLNEAILKEEYELASKLRDMIKKEKAKEKRLKKNKNNPS